MSNIFNYWNSATSSERLELVFEDRNKLYGAYKIRKDWSKNQVMAMIIAVAIAFCISGGSLAYNIYQNRVKPATKAKVVTKIESIDDIDDPEEEKPKEVPKEKEPEPQVETQAYTVPKINEETKQTDDELFDPNKLDNPSNVTKKGVKDDFGNFDPSALNNNPVNTGGGKGDGAVTVANKAKFPGGDEAFAAFIIKNFNYPTRCQAEGINGYVNLQFIVDEYGNVSNVQALDDTKSCPEFTDEAKRVIKLSKWIPGNTNGTFFKSYRTIPIILNITDP